MHENTMTSDQISDASTYFESVQASAEKCISLTNDKISKLDLLMKKKKFSYLLYHELTNLDAYIHV